MIKFASIGFVVFLVLIFTFGVISSFLPDALVWITFLNISALGLLAMGLLLISALIYDRYLDAQKEKDDDYKNY